jgi:hypothetical protein
MTDWLTAVNSLASAVIGGAMTLFIGERAFRRDRKDKQHIATMQVAVQLRMWLIDTMRTFRDHEVFHQPDPNDDGSPYGYYFPTPSDIPKFPFADSLERVSQLNSSNAQSVFGLIELRAKSERSASVTAEVLDFEEAADDFQRGICEVWLRALDVYQVIAKEVAWQSDVVTDAELADMKKMAEPPDDTGQAAVDIPEPPVPNATG